MCLKSTMLAIALVLIILMKRVIKVLKTIYFQINNVP